MLPQYQKTLLGISPFKTQENGTQNLNEPINKYPPFEILDKIRNKLLKNKGY